MMQFWKIVPGGNPTVLFRSQDVPKPLRVQTAEVAMSAMHLCAEQVGYIDMDSCTIEMMGGEFCVNAARAFAMLLAKEGKFAAHQKNCYEGQIKSSGCASPLRARVCKTTPGIWHAEICLEIPLVPPLAYANDGSVLIELPGITHIIEKSPIPKDNLKNFCQQQRKENRLQGAEAVGHIWLDPIQNPAETAGGQKPTHKICPVVWVNATQTLCKETACGSGTIAAAIYLSYKYPHDTFCIMQPSGSCLTVHFKKVNGRIEIWIGGFAWEVARGTTSINPQDRQSSPIFLQSSDSE